jgi:hypothetical protein
MPMDGPGFFFFTQMGQVQSNMKVTVKKHSNALQFSSFSAASNMNCKLYEGETCTLNIRNLNA